MKTHKVLLLALIVSAVLAVSAQAGKNHGNNNDSPAVSRPARGNSSTSSYGSGGRYGGRPTFAPSQRSSSHSMRSTYSPAYGGGSFRQRSFNSDRGATLSQRQYTPRTYSGSNGLARSENSRHFRTTTQSDRFTQIQSNRTNRVEDIRTRQNDRRLSQLDNRRTRDFATTRNIREDRAGSIRTGTRGLTTGSVTDTHVFSRRSADWQRNWDRSCDHWWRGHRCRFVNNSWIIFNIGFTPWYGYPYDYYASDYYYPYGYDAGYYGGDYYGGGYYGDAGYYSSDQYDGNTVAAAQEELARQGYYRGRIDGIVGPETRRAISRYQRDHGLLVSGYLDSDTLQSLDLRRVANY